MSTPQEATMETVKPLSEWSKSVIATSAQCYISRRELAYESGMSNSYLSRVLFNKVPTWDRSKEKIEAGLKTCVEKRGIRFEDVFP